MDNITTQTALMWAYQEVPKEPEPHLEYDSQFAHLPGCTVIGARCRGKKHKHDGTNCDDWFEIGYIDDWTVVAVADGAGSKKFSRIGAKTATMSAVCYVTDYLKQLIGDLPAKGLMLNDLSKSVNSPEYTTACGFLIDIIHNAVKQAYKNVKKAFEERRNNPLFIENIRREIQLSDFYSTMIISLIIPVKLSKITENIVISVQIGDGVVCSIDTKSQYQNAARILSNIDNRKASFAGETEFLNSETIKNLMPQTRVYRGVSDILMVMTDGVSDDYFPIIDGSKQLFMDLIANNILPNRKRVTKKNAHFAKKIPLPTAYPWVNDSSVEVALQYTDIIAEKLNKPLDFIWNNLGLLSYFTKNVTPAKIKDKGERLLCWLDNYTKRGSFDDRTLVILQLNKGNDLH